MWMQQTKADRRGCPHPCLSFAIHWGAVTLKVFADGPTLSPGFWYAYNNIEPSHVATVACHVMSTEQLLTSYYGFQDLPLSFSELGHGKISFISLHLKVSYKSTFLSKHGGTPLAWSKADVVNQLYAKSAKQILNTLSISYPSVDVV